MGTLPLFLEKLSFSEKTSYDIDLRLLGVIREEIP